MLIYVAMAAGALSAGWLAFRLAGPALRALVGPLLASWTGPAYVRPRDAATALPWWWRSLWPWAEALAPWAGTLCTWRVRRRLQQAAARAGLPPDADHARVAALCLCAALAAAGIAMGGGLAAGAERLPALAAAVLCAGVAACSPLAWLRAAGRRRLARMERDLPFLFDMMTLCVEAGLGVQAALQQAAHAGPAGPLRDELGAALADMRAGLGRSAAIRAMAERGGSPLLRNWAAALEQADSLGISLGPVLRAQAAQCRNERHTRAEQLAMQAPLKMLLPLIACIFPCTFIVLAYPIAMQLLQGLE